jgi:glycosidase
LTFTLPENYEMLTPVSALTRRRLAPALLLGLWALGAPLASHAQVRRDVHAIDARPVAPWVRDGVIYELNVRTFSPEGTFNAVTARLPELQKLGVTVVWLMPIHPIGEVKKKGSIGSPYAVRDYMDVNPAYGTKADLKKLVAEAHRVGLKVIIDIVANHTSWDNVLMKTPAYYKRDASGQILSPYDWTDVAALNYANPATRAYMHGVLQYWLREFDLDGYRCDVAGEVPTDFWEEARRNLEKIKPEIMMLAESHEPELLANAFDLDYGWPGYHALKDAILGTRSARAVREEWEAERRVYPRGALHMGIFDDHDEKRAITFFGERAALAAAALVFTMDGVPLLYNGNEVGDATESFAPALFEKLNVWWAMKDRRPEFPKFYDGIIPLRRAHSALRRGHTTWVRNSDEDRVITFVRSDATEDVLVAVNLTNRAFTGTVEVAGSGYAEITPGTTAAAAAAVPVLTLDPWGVRIFRKAK